LVNQRSPLLLFLLIFTCSGHRFSLSLCSFSPLCSLDSLYTLCLSFFCAGVSVVHVIALVNICYVAITNIHLCQFNFLCIFFFLR
jgi:hypothetical protein